MQSLQRLCGQIKSSIDQANRLLRALSSLSLHALPITYHLSPITHYPLPITYYRYLHSPSPRRSTLVARLGLTPNSLTTYSCQPPVSLIQIRP